MTPEEKIKQLEERVENLEKCQAPKEVQEAARKGFNDLVAFVINPEQEDQDGN